VKPARGTGSVGVMSITPAAARNDGPVTALRPSRPTS
jgi:hypothetical protein